MKDRPIKEQLKTLPKKPGVYFFLNNKRNLLYIGKAANIRSRVASHFSRHALSKTLAHDRLISETSSISFEETASEIEALVQEAELIKRKRPRYNLLMRDDKNYSFVGITRETFPRVFATHQPVSLIKNSQRADFIGPFTSARSLRITLRALRSLFPFCTCKKPHRRLCLNAHLGKCPGFCCAGDLHPTREEKMQYRVHIRALREILTGKKKRALISIRKAMERASRERRFEDAALLRDQLRSIEDVFSHSRVLRDWREIYSSGEGRDKALEGLAMLFRLSLPPRRIEAYDISNIQGNWAVGSLVVFQDGVKNISEYRRFRIKNVRGPNDAAMIHEVLLRRFNHKEWESPSLVIIDGGKPQLSAAVSAMQGKIKAVPIAALAKKEEELYIPGNPVPYTLSQLPAPVRNLLRHIRDESHRFALSYYRLLHRKSIASGS